MRKILGIAGPTGVGKSRLGMTLAEKMGTDIISADSAQIYIGMDIGTAKPTADECAQAVHHMVDVADPTEDFSVARYQEMAESCIADIQARGHRALLVGGTGLNCSRLRTRPAAKSSFISNWWRLTRTRRSACT